MNFNPLYRCPDRAVHAVFVMVLLMGLVPSVLAADNAPISEEKPFAEHFLVLQISDNEPEKKALVLSVASNLIEYYGPDKIAIQIVAFGPGIDVVFADYQKKTLVNSLAAQGVNFYGCMNTIDTITRRTGEKPDLNSHMIPVRAGVAKILELVDKGYTLVRP